MRVLLVYPSALHELIGYGDLGAVAEPLALEYLAAGLRLDGHEVRILDLRLHPRELVPTLLDLQPGLVGITGYSMHVLRMLAICRTVKELLPSCRTVVGGHHATLMPEDFFEPPIDFVVSGEGVAPLRRIAGALEGGGPAPSSPGVWTQVEGGFEGGEDPERFAIDDLPPPDRTLARGDRGAYFIDWMRPIALARTSVGCPYRCSFCSLWKIMEGRYHMRDVRRVAEELASIEEEHVFLVDDEPFVNGKRMTALAAEIDATGMKKRFFAYCRIDTLLRERAVMERWQRIGLERLFIGVEAPTQRGLAQYNKRLAIAQVEEGLRLARAMGIEVMAGFVVDTSSREGDFRELVRFIQENGITYPSFTVHTPIPGTGALTSFDHVTEKQPNGRPNWELFDLQHVVVETALPRAEFERHYRDLFRVFNASYAAGREHFARAVALAAGSPGGAGALR